jgi:hypothetical protein
MRGFFHNKRRFLIAQNFLTLAIVCVSAAIVSETFIRLPVVLKGGVVLLGFALFILGILICPIREEE